MVVRIRTYTVLKIRIHYLVVVNRGNHGVRLKYKIVKRKYGIEGKLCHQCCGSGIRCLFDPWTRIRDRFFSGSQISDPGSQTHIFERIVTNFWVKSSIIFFKLA